MPDPFALADPYETLYGIPSRRQPTNPALPNMTPEEEAGLFSKIGSGALHGLGWVGGVLDKAFGGRAIRGGVSLLQGKQTPLSELLSFIPGSDTLGSLTGGRIGTNAENSVSGAELIGGNKDTPLLSGEGLGGLALEVALDPSTYLTFGSSALTNLGKSALKAGIKPASGAARAAGLKVASQEAAELATHLTNTTGKLTTAADAAGKSLGGHVGIGLPFMGNAATFDLTKPLESAGSVIGKIPGASKVKEVTDPLRRGFSSLFEAGTKGQVDPVLQGEARTASAATPSALDVARGKLAPFGEEIQRMAGWQQGEAWSPVMEAESKRLGKQLAIALERTPSAADPAFAAIQAQHGQLLQTLDPAVVDMAQRIRQTLDAELGLEGTSGFKTMALKQPGEIGVEYGPRYGVQFEGGPRGSASTRQLPAEEIAKREEILRGVYREGPGSVNELTGTALGKTIQAMPAQDASQEILRRTFGWNPAMAQEYVTLANKQHSALGDVGKARQLELTQKKAAGTLSNFEVGELQQLEGRQALAMTPQELARIKQLGGFQEQAKSLAEWQRKLDLDALEKTGGFFGNHPLADMEKYLEKRAVNRLNADAAYNSIGKLATPDGAGAVKITELLDRLGLNTSRLDPGLMNQYVPKAQADSLSNWIRPSNAPEGAKPWLQWIDSITNLTKAGQTSWPATQARNVLSDVFSRFAYGGSPISPLMQAKTFREGGVLPGIAQKLGMQGISDAEATQGLWREMYQLGLMDTKKFQAMEAAGVNPLLETSARGMPLIGVRPKGIGETLAGHIPERADLTDFMKGDGRLWPLNVRGVGGRTESKNFWVGAAQSSQNYAEEMNRIATFLDARQRGFNPLASLGEVTKAHLDFGNLSEFEKTYMRRLVPFYCVPEEAQILTRDGWKNCDELMVGEEVMTYSMEKDCLEWQPCQDKAIFDHNQSIMEFVSKKKTFAFTPEHRWPVRQRAQKVSHPYGDYVYPEERKVVTGSELGNHHGFIQSAGFYGTESLLTPDQARLLGWIMTDGHVRKERRGHIEVTLCQSHKKFLKEAEHVAGNKHRPAVHPNGTAYITVRKDLKEELLPYLDKKNLVKVVTRLSRPAAEAMYEAMYQADGTQNKKRAGEFLAKRDPDVRAAERILAIMIGKTTTECDKGCCMSDRRWLGFGSGKIVWKHYKGRVWCPRTANGTWLMKQGRTVVITGNSWSRQNLPNMVNELARNPGGRMGQTMRLLNAGTDNGFLPETVSQTGYAIPAGQDARGRQNYLTSLGLPFEDLANAVSLRNMMGSTTPFARLPYELATGQQTFTGQNAPTTFPFEGSPVLNTLAMNSPLSRVFTTYRAAQRGLEGGNYWPVAMQIGAGPRITSVDPLAARRAAVRGLAEERLGSLPEISRFERLTPRPGEMSNLTPEQIQLLQLYQSINRRQPQR